MAVAVEADSRAFQLYVGGVMADPGCGEQLNHGVLVVGGGLVRWVYVLAGWCADNFVHRAGILPQRRRFRDTCDYVA